MLLVNAWVGVSGIHGLGVITHEFIPKGTVVWKLVPGYDVLISPDELENLPPAAQAHVRYYSFFHPDLKKHILCVDDDRFTNHSDDANQLFCGDHSIAKRDIQVGEELTDDYREFGKPLHLDARPPMGGK